MPRVKLFDETVVLEKAMNLFWKQGYSSTSMQDLVDHLGINRASLYDTFGGKNELFKKAFSHYRKINTEGLRNFFTNYPNVKEGFLAMFEMAIEAALNDKDRKGCFVVNTTTELLPGDESINSTLKENREIYVKLFYDYLKKGEEENQFESGKDLKSIASLLFMLYNGLKVVSKIEPDRAELIAPVQQALSLLD